MKFGEIKINNFKFLDGSEYITYVLKDSVLYHRLDGPAQERKGVYSYKMWWYNGQSILVNSQEEFERYLKLIAFQ